MKPISSNSVLFTSQFKGCVVVCRGIGTIGAAFLQNKPHAKVILEPGRGEEKESTPLRTAGGPYVKRVFLAKGELVPQV